jgi:CheY-like chemotaxis protein
MTPATVKPIPLPPVLVVDDNEAIRRTVGMMLTHQGSTATLATCGEDCLQALRAGFRGLILMDVNMPDMDGWDTVRAAIENGLLGDNLICMMTALTEPEHGSEDLAPYIFEYIAKPFNSRQLKDAVQMAGNAMSAHPGAV